MLWRTQRIAEGAEGADLIKDMTLRNLVKFGHTDGVEIGKKLPGPAAYLGPEIAAVIAEFDTGHSTDTKPTRRPAPTQPPPAVTQPAATQPPPSVPPVVVPKHSKPPPTASAPPVPDAALAHLTHADFCDYEYGESPVKAGPITVKGAPDGVRLTFEPYISEAGKTVLYRVVSGDDVEPFKPEAGDLVAVTTALEVADTRFLTAAVRHYQVWCHVGSDHEGARRSQPFLLATGQEISPVDDVVITENEGHVIGQWKVYQGTRAVRVFRVPLDGSGSRPDDPRNEICADQPNLTGFVDAEVERGSRYLYRVVAEVSVGGALRWSRPRQHDVLVSVVLTGVQDLTVTITEPNQLLDMVWTTPPVGQVQVYRSKEPPPADLNGSALLEAALEPQGFTNESRINYPVTAADPTHSRIAGVPWPTDWERVYLTPVTVLAGQARVGATTVRTRPVAAVTDIELVERFDTEIVTFGWPKGAVSVLAYVGSTTLSPEEICTRNTHEMELSKAQYDRDGGLYFARRLEPKGCTVCLVPVNYSRGEQVRGEIAAVHYPGLHRMRYQLIRQQVPGRIIVELGLWTDLEVDSSIALVMRHHPERMPLSADDGQLVYFIRPVTHDRLPQALIEHAPRGQSATGWRAEWTDLRGYFRVFVSQAADSDKRYALADPVPHQLFVSHTLGAPE